MDAEPTMSALEAARAIRETEGIDQVLKRRTSGVMWMLWGLLAPAIFMTFGFATNAAGTHARWLALLWMPWAALGILLTAMLWRSVRLVMPSATQRPRREIAWHIVIFLFVVVGGAWSVLLLHLPVRPPAVALAGLGVVSMVFGLTGILTVDALERRVRFVTGALLVVCGVGAIALSLPLNAVFVLGAASTCAMFFGSGLWQTLRG